MKQNSKGKAKPKNVSLAIKLLYSSLVLGVVNMILTLISQFSQTIPYFGFAIGITISVYLISISLILFFIYKVGKGKNWARIVILVLFLIAIPNSIIVAIQSLTTTPLLVVFDIGGTVLEGIAIILLFQKHSSDWFNAMKKE